MYLVFNFQIEIDSQEVVKKGIVKSPVPFNHPLSMFVSYTTITQYQNQEIDISKSWNLDLTSLYTLMSLSLSLSLHVILSHVALSHHHHNQDPQLSQDSLVTPL